MKKMRIELGIILPILFLAGFSLTIIFSLNPSLFSSQALFFLLGFLLFFVFSFLDWEDFLKSLTIPLYFLSLLFLGLTFLSLEIRGSHRWFNIFGLNLQPSELIKPFLIANFAQFIALFPAKKGKNFLINLFLIAVPVFLIFKQPDLGNAILYLGTWLMMIFAAPINWLPVACCLLPVACCGPFFWHFLKDYQQLRILSFLNPQSYSQTASYHSLQAKITIGSGQFLGKGLGKGTQSHLKFLPEYHTDFIFASLCEELGFLAGLIILLCYFFLLLKILKSASESESLFSQLFLIGVFSQLFLQIFINLGMNLGLVPITGVTLPLISYGGSSIVSTLIALGMVCSLRRKGKPEILVLG